VLGDEQFVAGLHRQPPSGSHRAVAKVQRRATSRTLEEYQHEFSERDEAMAQAYHSTAYTMEQIGNHFGVSAKTVSRAAKKFQLD
jgi:DNA-directed RNA polymerase specialized sigma subunit